MASAHTLTGLARADEISAECRKTARQLSGDDHGALFNATLAGAYRGQVMQLCFEIEELTRGPLLPFRALWIRGVEHNGQHYDIAFSDFDDVDQYRVFVAGTRHNVTGLCSDEFGLPDWIEDAVDAKAREMRETATDPVPLSTLAFARMTRGAADIGDVDAMCARPMPLDHHTEINRRAAA